ncbi:MAG: anthranilate phosphoribosyltransferase [Alphaproteobacteria bacterium]
MSDDLKPTLALIADGKPLTRADAEAAFTTIMEGRAEDGQIGAFLMGLRVRGETVDEIAAGAAVMRAKATKVSAPANAIDTCGTGGDAKGTYNISTAASFVVAAYDVPVAKHGNRALSSKSGASQVLEALGVKVGIPAEDVSRCIEAAGIGFMFAPAHHSAMKHVGPIRVSLGHRTIFNLLGPLSNPAGTKRQLIGVFAKEWVEPMAHVLNALGSERVLIAHGSDGLDELTTTGESYLAELKDGKVTTSTLTPEDVGLARASLDDLIGGTPEENAVALRAVLNGDKGPYRDIVALNAGAALMIAGKADSIADGVKMAQDALDDGRALARLEALVKASNG